MDQYDMSRDQIQDAHHVVASIAIEALSLIAFMAFMVAIGAALLPLF